MWLRSQLLIDVGFPLHGFTTKKGGVSEGPYSSWNFSTSTGDSEERVSENYRLLAERLGISPEAIFSVEQIHSDRIIELKDPRQKTNTEQADALLTSLDGLFVGVKTADCVPVLMADPDSGFVAAIHAGWKGVVAQIVGKTLKKLREYYPNARPYFAIGPHIMAEHFQVGPEVAEFFPHHHRPDPTTPGRFLVDLQGAITSELEDLGIPKEHIDYIGACTLSDPQQRFFSHRKSRGLCGRHFNFISNRRA